MWYWRFVLISLSTLQLTKCFYVAECLPEWVTKSREENRYMKLSEIPCPNGTRLPGGITFNSEFYREYPVTHTTTVVLSYVPWFVLFWACVEFIIIRGTRQLLFLGFSVSTINFNTFFLKHHTRPSTQRVMFTQLWYAVHNLNNGNRLSHLGLPRPVNEDKSYRPTSSSKNNAW